jgi:ABC-type transport system involved in cytochrome c biogenesis permease subunit
MTYTKGCCDLLDDIHVSSDTLGLLILCLSIFTFGIWAEFWAGTC